MPPGIPDWLVEFSPIVLLLVVVVRVLLLFPLVSLLSTLLYLLVLPRVSSTSSLPSPFPSLRTLHPL